MEKYCISVDWLQVYCLCNEIPNCEIQVDGMSIDVRLSTRETAQFKRFISVTHDGLDIAEIQQEPRTSVINSKATLLRLSNRVLYSTRYVAILYGIMGALNMQYKGITRIDLCYDCNRYKQGRSPSKFINTYISSEPETKGHIYRKGSDRFAAYGSKSRTSKGKISSIRFGSEKSRIGAYIYDKTLELKEVKDKPWIRELWAQNGLISDDDTHVFRSEISIKAEGTDMLNMSTGQLFRLSPEYLEHAPQIERLFQIYASKYFDFRICNGQKNRRNYDKLCLFESTGNPAVKPVYISKSADTGRMEKICYNKLEKLSRIYSDISEIERDSVYKAMEFLKMLSGSKHAILIQERYKTYLDELVGQKRISDLHKHYLSMVQECHEMQIEFDCTRFYDTYKSAGMMDPIPIQGNDVSDIDYLFT